MKTKKLLFACGLVSVMVFTTNAFAISDKTLDVNELSADVTVDGTLDAAWEAIAVLPIILNYSGTEVEPSDNYTASVRIAWRGTKVYFFISILDDNLVFERGGQGYGVQDNVNIYMNFSSDFATVLPITGSDGNYNGSSHQFRINFKNDEEAEQFDGRYAGSWDFNSLPEGGLELVTKIVDGGYNIEASIDLSIAWGYEPAVINVGEQFGLGFEAADIEDGAETHKLFWSADGNSWNDVAALGTATFKGAGDPNTGLSTVKENQTSLIRNAVNEVVILSKPNTPYQVYNLLGKKCFEGVTTSDRTVVNGLSLNVFYIFKVGDFSQKIIF